MSAIALVSGSIYRGPTERVAKNGNAYVTLVLKVAAGNGAEFWNAVVFDPDADIYAKDGQAPRVTRHIVADRALALKKRARAAA